MKSVMMNLQTADGVGFFGDGGSFFWRVWKKYCLTDRCTFGNSMMTYGTHNVRWEKEHQASRLAKFSTHSFQYQGQPN